MKTPTASKRTRPVLLVLAVFWALVVVPAVAFAPASGAGATSKVSFVQGVLGTAVSVQVDGHAVDGSVAPKAIVGPTKLSSGQHTVTFKSSAWTVKKSFDASQPSMDVVLHWPADPADQPVATVYTNNVGPVAAGKGRLTVAHTAVVPPADVRVSGKVLFANIANGEFVTAVVPAESYSVDLVPTGEKKPILGPVDLPVKAGLLTRVFAIGDPQRGNMDAIVQTLPLPKGGSQSPGSMPMGSAGLVAPNRTEDPGVSQDIGIAAVISALVALVVGTVLGARRLTHR